ncbi:hypothetical protein [Clostridium beijerinckii]|uniref:Uncharacterized protein n=1 Tax=Clostridium beijerinckii TaxID=1520 RepID=A0AAX0AXB1_CLOBE|nr:hypothetical protein [Clostridium beijerinckii]NRT87269.1 hypothetical protein [Clostridium beijerinckii]NYC72700.1 hypothetical protein [Clostridium beijerinckii]
MENKAELIDELQEIKENIKNHKLVEFLMDLPYPKYSWTLLSFLIVYFFYQLGYVFIYGFYFGGDVQNSIFNISINPVPFNFKAIVVVGVFLLIYILVLCFPVIISISHKSNVFAFIFLFIIIFLIVFSLEYMFWGKVSINQAVLPATILGIPIFFVYMVYAMMNFQTYKKLTIINAIYYLLIVAIINSFYNIILFYENPTLIVLTSIYVFFVIPQINKKIAKYNAKKAKVLGKSIGITLFMILILRYSIYDQEIYFLFFVYLIMLIYLEGSRYEIMNLYRVKFLKNNKAIDTQSSKYDKVIITCAWIIGVIILYPVFATCVFAYGSYIGDAVMKSYPSNIISYEFSKEDKSYDKKEGIVVAQQGDTYYISQLPYRKLAIIKSKSIIVD